MAASEDDIIVILDDDDNNDIEGSSSSSSSAATVQKNEKETMECPICLQPCIHPARLPCGHIFCFLCVKGVAYKNRRCAMCRREIPTEFLDHPQLVHGIQDLCKTKSTEDGYQWFYEGRNGWWQYDERTSQDIEDAYKKGEKSCTILVAGYVYVVDFSGMLQQRQNDPSRRRHVKRDLASVPKKGVAGLRIEGNVVATDSNYAAQLHRSEDDSVAAGDDDDNDRPFNIDEPLNNLESTIAATDAAIRIASDIIDSTLAHADDFSLLSALRLGHDLGGGSNPFLGNRELFNQSNELLVNNTTTNSINQTQHQDAIDLIQQTLNEFQLLSFNNIGLTGDSDDDNIL